MTELTSGSKAAAAAPGAMRTLYLCYFGLREPLVQTQVLPYLHQLSKEGIEVTLLTFEPNHRHDWSAGEVEAMRRELRSKGLRWYMTAYHKRPKLFSTLYDIVSGTVRALQIARRHNIEVLHARAHVPMMIALMVRRWASCRVVFDIRGLMAEEYADAGTWKEGSLVFRAVKWLERVGIQRADQIVVLTKRMQTWLVEHHRADASRIEVIPCCVDFSRFNGVTAEPSGNGSRRFEVIYAGSAAGLYLVKEMARFFRAVHAQRPDAFLRILTTTPRESVVAALKRECMSENDFWVGSVSPEQVPAYLRRARLGVSFRKPTFSQIAASPTKIPEYLAAELPVVSNEGIGDTDDLVENAGVGVVVRSFDSQTLADAARRALAIAADPNTRARCSRVARREFDLEGVGAIGYRRVYQRIREQVRLEARLV